MEKAWEEEKPVKENRMVLIPVDFADHIPKTIDFGFQMAEKMEAEVVFLYVYFTPLYNLVNNDVGTYSISDSELLRGLSVLPMPMWKICVIS